MYQYHCVQHYGTTIDLGVPMPSRQVRVRIALVLGGGVPDVGRGFGDANNSPGQCSAVSQPGLSNDPSPADGHGMTQPVQPNPNITRTPTRD